MTTDRAAQSAEELALLRGVVADLSDRTRLGAYCDWLDDHDDRRGPFLRSFLRAFDARQRLPPDPPWLSPAWAEVLALPIRRRLREAYSNSTNELTHYMVRERLPNGFVALEPYFDHILRAAHPSIRMTIGKPRPLADFPPGTSRTDGLPDLPEETPWPMGEYRGGPWPYRFLFQIDLANLQCTLADGLMPRGGLLTVFHWIDLGDGGSRILSYTPPGAPLVRLDAPVPYMWHPDILGDVRFRADQSHPVSLTDALRYPYRIPGIPDVHGSEWGDYPPLELCDLLVTNWWEQDKSADGPFLCTPWHPEICPWEGGDDLPGYLKLIDLPGNSELLWGFGDGGRMHVAVPAEDARNGVFGRAEWCDV